MKSKLLLFVLFFSVSSHSSLILEPFISYESGSLEGSENFGSNTTVDKDLTGHSYGLLFSFAVYKGLGLNFTYGQSSSTLEGNNLKQDVTFNDYGPYIAIPINERWNLWLAYVISSSDDYTDSLASTGKISGTGTKFGVGYMAAPHVRLNLEYLNVNYNTVNGGSSSDEVSLARKSVVFTVGFPFLLWESK